MVVKVEDVEFFHINSTANGSPHDLLRCGATVSIGNESNPFFRFYETYARAYPVRYQNGTVEQVPAVTFLKRVKEGAINPDNLPGTAHEVSKHFMMLARELVWENVRLQDFPEAPSRQQCIWLIKNEQDVEGWQRAVGFAPHTHRVVKVRATGTALDVDGRLLAEDSETLPVWCERAGRYWAGEMTENPLPETLFVGTLHVEEALDHNLFTVPA